MSAAPFVRRLVAIFDSIDVETGWKADIMVRKPRRFSVMELSRRQPARILGVDTYVATAEDTILTKLEWAKSGGSDRQLEDVRALLAVATIDEVYIEKWAEELELTGLWSNVRGG